MGAQFSQIFPPKPTFTLDNIGPQDGKVFIVTGGASGIGFEVAKALYAKGGKVYIAGRSEQNANTAIATIQKDAPGSAGSLHFLHLELDDLTTIKSTMEDFKSREQKLDVLFNNAGVSQPPVGSVSKQGFELQLATNCLGPFHLTHLLIPLLRAAGTTSGADPARIIWLGSQVMELSAPKGGIVMSELSNPPKDQVRNYTTSKVGNYFLSMEFVRRFSQNQGIISAAVNPGALNTNLLRNAPWLKFFTRPLLYPPSFGALSVLYAAISVDITLENSGVHVIPWGRIHDSLRADLIEATKVREDGEPHRAQEFWDFCEQATKPYL